MSAASDGIKELKRCDAARITHSSAQLALPTLSIMATTLTSSFPPKDGCPQTATTGKTTTSTSTFPQVKLDWTLYDLYSLDGGDPDKTAIVMSGPIPFGSVSSSLPANTKYVYQSPTAPDLGRDVYARLGLGNGTQNHYFSAGPMNVYLFDIEHPKYDVENNCAESPPSHHTDAFRVYDGLVPEQRPKVHFIPRHDELKMEPGVSINPYPPMDFLDAHTCIMDQEKHYGLLSKRDLALSGLPSPKTKVVDGQLTAEDAKDDEEVEREVERFVQAVQSEALPFVIKFPQSVTGQGVWFIGDEQQRESRMELLRKEVGSMIRALNKENEHLNVVSLLLQQLVVDGRTNNMSFFITPTGRPVFVSCCEQMVDSVGIWKGSTIDYERQKELEDEFMPLIQKVTAHVYKQGFTGGMGFDVMTDRDGNQLVVDMNVRLTGDFFMGPLRSHYKSRGMRYSYFISPLVFTGDRDTFEKLFSAELHSGRMIILGWCRGKVRGLGSTYSVCSFSIGGTSVEEMLSLGERVYSATLPRPS